jgi:hypothetical protein
MSRFEPPTATLQAARVDAAATAQQGRSYRCQAALAGSLCPIWLSAANTSRAT